MAKGEAKTDTTGSLSDSDVQVPGANAVDASTPEIPGKPKNKYVTGTWSGVPRVECPYCTFDAVGDTAESDVDEHVTAVHPDKWMEE